MVLFLKFKDMDKNLHSKPNDWVRLEMRKAKTTYVLLDYDLYCAMADLIEPVRFNIIDNALGVQYKGHNVTLSFFDRKGFEYILCTDETNVS